MMTITIILKFATVYLKNSGIYSLLLNVGQEWKKKKTFS